LSNNTLSVDSLETKRIGGFSAKDRLSGLVGQIFAYVIALLIPGLVNLLSLALYTRLLSTEAYGRYALVLAVVVIVKMVAFEWLRIGLIRFFQGAQRDGHLPALLSTTIACFIIICLLVSLAWVVFLIFVPVEKALRADLWLGLPLLLAWALFEQILQMNRSALAPIRYGLLSAMRAILGLAVALGFIVLFNQGEKGLILGLVFGTAISALVDLPRWIRRMALRLIKRVLIADLLRYGMPLTVSLSLGIVVYTVDRFLIQYFLGSASVGLYAAGYDLTRQILVLMFMVVNLAAYPLVVRTLEQEGEDAARQQLHKFCIILLMLTLPASVGLALIAHPLSDLFLAKAFRQSAESLIPWIALSTFLMSMKAFYFDLAFHLGFRTGLQIWVMVATTALVIILDVCWIPAYGLMGAAYAAVAAYALALIICVGLGRKAFRLPFPVSDFGRIALATLFMAVVLVAIPKHNSSWVMLCTMVCLGAVVYTLIVWLTDVGEVRRHLASILQRLSITFRQKTR